MSEAPWYEDGPPLAPVDPLVEAWARALCVAAFDKPDRIVGNPPVPQWRNWVTPANRAIEAAAVLGYVRQTEAA